MSKFKKFKIGLFLTILGFSHSWKDEFKDTFQWIPSCMESIGELLRCFLELTLSIISTVTFPIRAVLAVPFYPFIWTDESAEEAEKKLRSYSEISTDQLD